MEELFEKTESMRKSIKSMKIYKETDIYVILSPPDANAARTPCSALLITALEKLRESAGVLRSIVEPNLILVAHMSDMPVTSHCFMHWDEPTFCKNVAADLQRIVEIFDNKFKNIRPFLRLKDEKFLALYGPHQETIEFEFRGHQKNHESMKKAIKSIITDDSPNFQDFQLAVHTAIYSLNCEHCLFHILNPLDTIEKLQKFVKTLTRGVWCPRDRKEMKTTMEWVDEKGKKCMRTCWRLEEGVRMPKVETGGKVGVITSANDEKPAEKVEMMKNPKEHHLKTLQNVMQLLSGNIQKLGDETDFKKMEKSNRMAHKLKAHNIGLSLLYMELQKASFDVGAFGFGTGDTELDEGLERAAAEMLKMGSFDISLSGIIAKLDKKLLIKYKQIKDPLRTEKGLIDRIAGKLRKIVETNSGKYEEKQKSTSSESPSESSDSESNSEPDSDSEDTPEDPQKSSDTSDDSYEPQMSPVRKRAKMEKGAELQRRKRRVTKPTSSTPKNQTVEPPKPEVLKNASPISPEVIDVEDEKPEEHENLNVLENAISPAKTTKEVEVIEIEDDDVKIQNSPASEVIFEYPEPEDEPEHKKIASYARRTGKPYIPGDSEDDEDSEEEKGAEPEEDDEISVIFDSGDVRKGNDSADSSFNFTVME